MKRYNINYYSWDWKNGNSPVLIVKKLDAELVRILAVSPILSGYRGRPIHSVQIKLDFRCIPRVKLPEVEALLQDSGLNRLMNREENYGPTYTPGDRESHTIRLEFIGPPSGVQRGPYVAGLVARLVRELGIRDAFMPYRSPDVCIRSYYGSTLTPYGRILGEIIEETLA